MIDILMATYNGERFICEQIDSILNQTYKDFRLLIRDDGSKDRTVEIIKEYESKYPQKIFLIEDDIKCGSAVSNFMQLTKNAISDYVMYCDQDDVWLENKIDITLKRMKEIEAEIGQDKPILVFSTYQPVDSDLNHFHMKEGANQISAYKLDISHLLVQNYVTGCLTMCNKALYSMIGEYSSEILMHDWWLALIASAMGRIEHIPDITMLYRQHSNNVAGATDVKSAQYRLSKFRNKSTRDAKYLLKKQAELFLARYEKQLDETSYNCINNYVKLFDYGKIKRMRELVCGKYLKGDIVRIAGQLWYI